MPSMQAGSAYLTINPELGADLAGQLHRRFCEFIRDDLEANALYLANDELQVLLVNLGGESVTISRGMRIAQLVIAAVARTELQEVNSLDETSRGIGGFGSTGS